MTEKEEIVMMHFAARCSCGVECIGAAIDEQNVDLGIKVFRGAHSGQGHEVEVIRTKLPAEEMAKWK